MRVQLAGEYTDQGGNRLGGTDDVIEVPDLQGEQLMREGWARYPDDEDHPERPMSEVDKISAAQVKRVREEGAQPAPTPTAGGSDASVVAPGPEGGQGTQGAAGGGSAGGGGTGAAGTSTTGGAGASSGATTPQGS